MILDITNALKASDEDARDRSLSDIMLSLNEEVGELATEVAILNGFKRRRPGRDGVVGEAVDAIICLIDIIHQSGGSDELQAVFDAKVAKWHANTSGD